MAFDYEKYNARRAWPRRSTMIAAEVAKIRTFPRHSPNWYASCDRYIQCVRKLYAYVDRGGQLKLVGRFDRLFEDIVHDLPCDLLAYHLHLPDQGDTEGLFTKWLRSGFGKKPVSLPDDSEDDDLTALPHTASSETDDEDDI